MNCARALRKMKEAGFEVALDGDALYIRPFDRLTEAQRDYVIENMEELVAELLASNDPHVEAIRETFELEPPPTDPSTPNYAPRNRNGDGEVLMALVRNQPGKVNAELRDDLGWDPRRYADAKDWLVAHDKIEFRDGWHEVVAAKKEMRT